MASKSKIYKSIILISADTEWKAILDLIDPKQKEKSPFGEYFISNGLLFFQGGFGKVAAAASTQYIIDQFHPRIIINLGTCGGFEGEVQVGDILLVDKTLIYDVIDLIADYHETIQHYTTHIDLRWLKGKYPQKVRRSLLVSADQDILPEEIGRLKKEFGAVAADWESGAIAWVASRNQTRVLILRGVSDVVNESGSLVYGNLTTFFNKTKLILANLLDHLPLWVEKSND